MPLLSNLGRCIVLLGLCAVSLLPSAASMELPCGAPGSSHVPAYVKLAAAREGLADFAQALASAGICAGLVSAGGPAGELTRAWHLETSRAPVPLGDAIEAFAASHPTFAVREIGGFLLFSDRDPLPQENPLARVVSSFEIKDVPASEAIRELVRQVAGESGPEGRVGSSLDRPEDPPLTREQVFGPIVTIHEADVTVFDVLVSIGQHSPGLVWVVSPEVEEPRRSPSLAVRAFTSAGQVHSLGTLP